MTESQRMKGAIRFRPDRPKPFRARVWIRGRDGAWFERSKSFRTAKEAKAWRAQQTLTPTDRQSDLTLAQWYDKKWASVEETVRQTTAVGYQTAWRLRLEPTLGHLKLSQITPTDIDDAIAEWSGGTSCKVQAFALLSRLMDKAEMAHVIMSNPVRFAARPKVVKPSLLRSHALSPEEVVRLLEITPTHYQPFVATLAFTGIRFGEGAGMRVQALDLLHNVAMVREQTTGDGRGGLRDDTPKSHRERVVPISQILRPYILKAMDGKGPSDRLFVTPRGATIQNTNFRRAVKWDHLAEAIGRPDLRIHDLRHTAATLMIDAGIPVPDVQAILGHASIEETERYTRSREGAASRAGEPIDRLMSGPLSGPDSGPEVQAEGA